MSVHGVSSHPFASHSHGASDSSQNALARKALQAETAHQQNDQQSDTPHKPTRDVSHQVDKTA